MLATFATLLPNAWCTVEALAQRPGVWAAVGRGCVEEHSAARAGGKMHVSISQHMSHLCVLPLHGQWREGPCGSSASAEKHLEEPEKP